jgi:hypothetical protein
MISVGLARHDDSASLGRLLHQTSLPGTFTLSYTRDPDFFSANGVDGFQNQVIITRENNTIGCLAIRTIKKAFINGIPQSIGYMHTVRSTLHNRGSAHLLRAFMYYRKLHRDNMVPAYLATTVENPAGSLDIIQRLSNSFSTILDLGRLITYSIPLSKSPPRSRRTSMEKGSVSTMPEIIEFLRIQGARRQFYPCYTETDFRRLSDYNFLPENFYISRSGNRINGVLAIWDLSGFKQIRVRGYGKPMSYCRYPMNIALRLVGFHPVPSPGSTLNCIYACCIAIENDNPEILSHLIEHARWDLSGSDRHFLCMGFHENDPLRASLRQFFSFSYISRIYCFSWDDGSQFCNSLQRSRIPYLEICAL